LKNTASDLQAYRNDPVHGPFVQAVLTKHDSGLQEFLLKAIETSNIKETSQVRRYRGCKKSTAATCCVGCCSNGACNNPEAGARVCVFFFDKANAQQMQATLFWGHEQVQAQMFM
jgi:hypothetical protein